MVKVTLEEENNKTIKHECECAFACMIRPTIAPEGSNAVLCLGGEINMISLARAVATCAINAFDIMANGDETAKYVAVHELLQEISKECFGASDESRVDRAGSGRDQKEKYRAMDTAGRPVKAKTQRAELTKK